MLTSRRINSWNIIGILALTCLQLVIIVSGYRLLLPFSNPVNNPLRQHRTTTVHFKESATISDSVTEQSTATAGSVNLLRKKSNVLIHRAKFGDLSAVIALRMAVFYPTVSAICIYNNHNNV